MASHKNSFLELQVPRNKETLNQEFIDEWVIPFKVFDFSEVSNTKIEVYLDAIPNVNRDVVSTLLDDFNWRMKIAGTYFAILKDFKEFESAIGNHLLRSEVCYAGHGYSVALAIFATEKSKTYLTTYLDYYLTKKDLWFDQNVAMSALYWLDENEAEKYKTLWQEFIENKTNWDLEHTKMRFNKEMGNIAKIRESLK